jgi:undecaprenyl-diphosphatase
VLGWDRHLERWQAAHRACVLDPVFEWLTYAGTWGAVWLVLAAAFAAWWRRPAILVETAVAVLLGWGVAEALQAVIPRARPHGRALVARPHTHSFPSGHATIAFAAATVLGALAPRGRIVFYLLAAAIAWSRVYVGVHYPLDVLAGAALGTALGSATVRGLPPLAAARRRSRPVPPPG